MEYQSNALWPSGVCHSKYGDDISTDRHETYEMARSACMALERDGFGGQREQFPIMTWVSNVEQPPRIPVDGN